MGLRRAACPGCLLALLVLAAELQAAPSPAAGSAKSTPPQIASQPAAASPESTWESASFSRIIADEAEESGALPGRALVQPGDKEAAGGEGHGGEEHGGEGEFGSHEAERAELVDKEDPGLGDEGDALEERGGWEVGGMEAEEFSEVEVSEVDIGIAWMLLGSVAFVMVLFYLVNWPDDDIRRYSWTIISTTVSIFTAVLLFQGIDQFIMSFVQPENLIERLCIKYGLFLLWFCMLQATIAYVSGANCESHFVNLSEEVWVVADAMRADFCQPVEEGNVRNPIGDRSIAFVDGLEVFVHKCKLQKEVRLRMMRCWATLLAHMTGFAAINAGGSLQHLKVFSQSWPMAMLSMLINQIAMQLLFSFTRIIRARTIALDGMVDERDELFEEEVLEAENDIASLSVSFLTVQALRFALSGQLPNVEGMEEPERPHDLSCVLGLYTLGLIIGICSVLLLFAHDLKWVARSSILGRVTKVLQNQGSMIFAWCVLWGTRWQVLRSDVLQSVGGPNTMAGRILIALALSFCALMGIFGLDQIEDFAKSRDDSDGRSAELIQSIINALGILVGFSWEHSFDGGVAAVASLTRRPVVIKFLLGFVVALVIVPAWRRYILQKVMVHKRIYAEELQARRKVEVEASSDF